MKKTIIMSLFFSMFAMLGLCAGGRISPIENGKLVTDLNGNSKKVVGLTSVQVGTHTINQEFLDSIINGSSVETLTFQNVTGIVDHAISLIPPCPAEVDAVALVAIASLTNQARVWIDAPGATRWATVVGNQIVTWGVANFFFWEFSADGYKGRASLPPYQISTNFFFTVAGMADTHPSSIIEVGEFGPYGELVVLGTSGYNVFAQQKPPISIINWYNGSTDRTASLYLNQETSTNILSTATAPIAPIPPYVTTYTGLTNWVACQNIFEAALISGMTVNREAFDVATNTLAQAAEEAYGRSSTAITYLNAHTDNGTIAADKHLLTGDRGLVDSISGKLARSGDTATNLTVAGCLRLANSQATNLVIRLCASNDYIVVEHVLP